MNNPIRILGIDPSLVACGWGVIESQGNKMRHIAHGVIRPPAKPATHAGLSVGEYSPRSVKKSVVGTGAADKAQVAHMMNVLLPGCGVTAGDAADALAIAICHAHRVSAAGTLYKRFA